MIPRKTTAFQCEFETHNKRHYFTIIPSAGLRKRCAEVSQKVGGLVFFPAIRTIRGVKSLILLKNDFFRYMLVILLLYAYYMGK